METETFIDIIGYENKYQISNLGNVKALNYKGTGISKIMAKSIGRAGYYKSNLCIRGFRFTYLVHRLIALAFIPNPENKPQINHKDGNKLNNDINNLEWCTGSENIRHAYDKLGMTCGERLKGGENKRSKKISQYTKSGEFVKTFGGMREAAREMNIHQSAIGHCALGKRPSAAGYIWKYE